MWVGSVVIGKDTLVRFVQVWCGRRCQTERWPVTSGTPEGSRTMAGQSPRTGPGAVRGRRRRGERGGGGGLFQKEDVVQSTLQLHVLVQDVPF